MGDSVTSSHRIPLHGYDRSRSFAQLSLFYDTKAARPNLRYTIQACCLKLSKGVSHFRIYRLAPWSIKSRRHLSYDEILQLLGLQ